MSTVRPKLAVVGGGKFGLMHLRAYKQLEREGRAELVGLCDINEDLLARRRQEFGVRTYTDYRELIERERPDGVSVVTPDHLHRDIGLFALGADCHVLIEKPLEVTVEGCRELTELADRRGRILMVDFHKRYDPYHQALRAQVRAGRLGEVLYGYAHMEDRIEVPRDWWPGWAAASSPVWFLGVHMFDLIRWVIGSDPVRVHASGRKKKLADLGIDTYDCIQTKVEFASGATFTVDASWVLPDGFEAVVNQGIRVVGTEGIMEVDSQDRGARSCFAGEGMATYNLGFFEEARDKRGQVVYSGYGIASIQDFALNVAHLLAGGSLEELAGTYADGHDGLQVTRVAVAAHQSLRSGEVVELPVEPAVQEAGSLTSRT